MSLLLSLGDENATTDKIGYNLRHTCNDCPFRKDAPMHHGVAMSIMEYLRMIDARLFAHTCHKTDNRPSCDGPKNYKGEVPEHCAGALHFLIKAKLDGQLPILQAMNDGRLNYEQARKDAETSPVFSSSDELIRYYMPVMLKEINERKLDPPVCVTFAEQPMDPPTMIKLSTARAQGLTILPCSTCGKPATHFDNHWPYHLEANYCDDCGGDGKSFGQMLTELQEMLTEFTLPKHRDWFVPGHPLSRVIVNKATGCHEWTMAKNEKGYGVTCIPGTRRTMRAHRLAYETLVGPIPDKTCLLHSCDNPACCNPDHLSFGDRAKNNADMIAKGRQKKGESRKGKSNCQYERGASHHASKLKADDVIKIREMRTGGATYAAIAEQFGLRASSVGKIIRGELWAHVK